MSGQFMYCQIMGWTVHVLSYHGMDSSCIVRPWDGQFMYCQIMGWSVYVLSQIMGGEFMYCQIKGWSVHVMSDLGMDSSCTVRPWMDSSCTVRSWDGQFM